MRVELSSELGSTLESLAQKVVRPLDRRIRRIVFSSVVCLFLVTGCEGTLKNPDLTPRPTLPRRTSLPDQAPINLNAPTFTPENYKGSPSIGSSDIDPTK